MSDGPAGPEPSDLAHLAELLREREAMARELEQADADYLTGNTISGEEVRRRYGLAEAPAPHRRFGQLPDLVVPDNFDDPIPGFEG